jgi:hypothetical protein
MQKKKPTRNVVQTDGKTHTDGGTELKFKKKKERKCQSRCEQKLTIRLYLFMSLKSSTLK